ncbi:MAG: diguanylate cyclase [Clostridiales bacterium]|nr:diguanylate cyclase [Clostridiales bacterium]
MNIYMVIFFAVSLNYLFIGINVFSKDYYSIKNRIFFNMAFALFAWAGIYAMMFLITDPIMAAFTRKLTVFTWGIFYTVLFQFILLISNQEGFIRKKPYLGHFLLYSPSLMNIYLYFFNPVSADELNFTSRGWVYVNAIERGFIWDNYFYVYYMTFTVLSLVFAYRWRKNTVVKREKKQANIVLATISIALLFGTIFEIVLPINGVFSLPGVTTIIALIPFYGMWYASEKLGLISFKPEKLSVDVLQMMSEGIILENNNGDIEMINSGAREILGYDNNDNIEHISNILIGNSMDLNEISAIDAREIQLMNKQGNRIDVLISTMPLYDSIGEKYGSLNIFQDISNLKEAQVNLMKMNETLEIKVFERTESLIKSNRQLLSEVKERKIAEYNVRKMAYYDSLTDLPNQRYFSQRIEEAIKNADSNSSQFAVLFIDLDLFKRINDAMGHSKGDELLIIVANRLKNLMRQGDFVARSGGDEFLVIIENLNNREELELILDRLLDIFKEPFIIDNHEFNVTCSVGASIYPDHENNMEELVKFADIAMYEAKGRGRNFSVIFNNDMKEGLLQELNLTNDLYNAVKNNELELYYQPQVDSNDNSIIGVEALIRWHHPKLGMIPPLSFIPMAEKTGLILEIGEWVIKTAIDQKKRMERKKHLECADIRQSFSQPVCQQ